MLLVVFLALLKCKLAEEHEDLKNLFLSLWDCIGQMHVESTACKNPRFVEYLHNCFQGVQLLGGAHSNHVCHFFSSRGPWSIERHA